MSKMTRMTGWAVHKLKREEAAQSKHNVPAIVKSELRDKKESYGVESGR